MLSEKENVEAMLPEKENVEAMLFIIPPSKQQVPIGITGQDPLLDFIGDHIL
jgi:hypothetical protein